MLHAARWLLCLFLLAYTDFSGKWLGEKVLSIHFTLTANRYLIHVQSFFLDRNRGEVSGAIPRT